MGKRRSYVVFLCTRAHSIPRSVMEPSRGGPGEGRTENKNSRRESGQEEDAASRSEAGRVTAVPPAMWPAAVPTELGWESDSGLLAPHPGKQAGKKGRKDKRRPGEKEKRCHRERKERVSLRLSSCWKEWHKGTSYQGLGCGSGGGPVGEGARPPGRQAGDWDTSASSEVARRNTPQRRLQHCPRLCAGPGCLPARQPPGAWASLAVLAPNTEDTP